ncbi:MAG TPA: XdhC/CoxI family protein [Candidatus Limnocylindrales bacterium]|nr:XdhC/CoxI family protein [Candidatus Limnocylindrales bacterium]
MRDLIGTLDEWRAGGVDVGRAVVVRAFGSSPWAEGATLLVSGDGRLAGSISGGCVEAAAAEAVLEVMHDGRPRLVEYGVADEDAWSVGLACGGRLEVLLEPSVRAEVVEAARAADGGSVVTELPGPRASRAEASAEATGAGAELAASVRAQVERGTSGAVEAAGRRWFVELFPTRPRLVVVGAVHVALTLVRLARELGWHTLVIDPRAAFATPERFPEADVLRVGWPDELADEIRLGPADAVAVLTHDPKVDEPAIAMALARGCRYVGAIGSRATQAGRRERLLAAGVPAPDLARLRGPIGLDLGGREPAETALAIMAEIVAARHGAAGGALSGSRADPGSAVAGSAPPGAVTAG